jgi:hypothetical protein
MRFLDGEEYAAHVGGKNTVKMFLGDLPERKTSITCNVCTMRTRIPRRS